MPNLSPSLTQTPLSQMLNLSLSHIEASLSLKCSTITRGWSPSIEVVSFTIMQRPFQSSASQSFSMLLYLVFCFFFFFGCFCFHRSGEENEDIFFQWWREWDFGSEFFSMLGVIFSFVWMFFVFGGEGNEDRDFCSEICSRRVKTNEWIKNW